MGFKSDKQRKAFWAKQRAPYRKIALEVLDAGRIPLSTKEVADEAKMDWATAKKTLNELKKKGRVKEKNLKNKRLWEIK